MSEKNPQTILLKMQKELKNNLFVNTYLQVDKNFTHVTLENFDLTKLFNSLSAFSRESLHQSWFKTNRTLFRIGAHRRFHGHHLRVFLKAATGSGPNDTKTKARKIRLKPKKEQESAQNVDEVCETNLQPSSVACQGQVGQTQPTSE